MVDLDMFSPHLHTYNIFIFYFFINFFIFLIQKIFSKKVAPFPKCSRYWGIRCWGISRYSLLSYYSRWAFSLRRYEIRKFKNRSIRMEVRRSFRKWRFFLQTQLSIRVNNFFVNFLVIFDSLLHYSYLNTEYNYYGI